MSWKNPGGGTLEEELLEDEFLEGGGNPGRRILEEGSFLEEESWRPSPPRPTLRIPGVLKEETTSRLSDGPQEAPEDPRWHPETPRRPPGAKRLLGLKTCPNHGVSWLKVVHFTCARATDPHPVW